MNPPERPRFPILLASIFALLATGIAVAGFLYYQRQKKTIQQERYGELSAIADLKASQIEAWRMERLEDARFFHEDPIAAPKLRQSLVSSPRPDHEQHVLAWITGFQTRNGYANLVLLDSKGAVRLSAPSGVHPLDPETLILAKQAMKTGRVVFSDLYRSRDNSIHLDLFAPILSLRDSAPMGVVVLRIDPRDSLYPQIENLPIPSRTAETLLLRREGGEVLYLNELRHRKGTALSLRLPAGRTALARVLPVPGPRGVGEAIDYRGVPIVAAARPVPSSTWIVIAKMDLEEIYGPIRQTAALTALIGCLLFAATATGALLVWRHQQARFYQRQYAAEIERQRLVERLEYLSSDAHDIILLADHTGRILDANKRAVCSFGYEHHELLRMTMRDLWPSEARSLFESRWAQIQELEAQPFETVQQRKDLSTFPVEMNVRLISVHGGAYYQSISRDISEKKTAEGWRRLLESAILQASDGVMILEVSGEDNARPQAMFVNSAFERMTGFSLVDLRQGALARLDGARPNRCYHGRPKSPVHLEQLTGRKDGSQFWAERNCVPLADPEGNYTHCVWTYRDITERKQSEAASRLLSSIVESSDDAIIGIDLQGTVLSWNQGATRSYGYSSEEMLGRSVSVLVPSDHPDELPATIEQLRLGKKIERFETQRVKKDGQRIFVSLTVSPLRDGAGSVIGASGITRDITERKRAERALQLSEERYRSLAFVTTQIVWTASPEGEVVEDLPMWRTFTGQNFEEIQGWGWITALHPDDRAQTAEIWSRSVRCRSFYRTEYRMRRHDGEYRWMAVHGVPVLQQDGGIREWVGTCADITDRKLAEEEVRKVNEELEERVSERTAQLEAANLELEAFAYSVSHDLRAPLRAVDGFSRILLEDFASQLPAEAQHYLEVSRKNAQQMGDLIDGLLAFSRLGRQPLCKQTLAPSDMVRQALQELDSERQGRRIELNVADLPLCEGDPLLLKQVFVNLLSNAFKYTRSRDVVRIEVGAEGPSSNTANPDCAVYYVRDNGVGFDMRFHDKLFGVFQRLHRAEEYEGTGVGLATVQRIVHRHGGRVWADATVNHGATFYFTLEPYRELKS